MRSLGCYYKEVKAKRQLSLEVPTGFRQSSELQPQFHALIPPQKSSLESSDVQLYTFNKSLIQTLIMDTCTDPPYGLY